MPRPPKSSVPASIAISGRPGLKPARIEDIAFEPVTALASRLRARQISSTQLTRMYLDRLKQHDPALLCVVTLTEDLALAQAEQADREIRSGKYRGPLHGIPYGIKDIFAAKGTVTTWGVKQFASRVIDYDSTAVTRLREAGAVLVAKLATGALAVTDMWFRGRTRNPWNPQRGSEGSSAGSASATSAGLVGFAVGTEAGGSTINPASTCGIVGLRPTFGRVSLHGCLPTRWTIDKIGVMARSVADTALVLGALHGPDGHDERVPDLPFAWDGVNDVKGVRIGYDEREFAEPAATASAQARQRFTALKPFYDSAFDVFRKRGATLVPLAMPDLPTAAVTALMQAELGSVFDDLLRNGGLNESEDESLRTRAGFVRVSRFIPAVDYIRAQRVRTLVLQRMRALFEKVDVYLAPAAPLASGNQTNTTNLTGHPAVVLPAGIVDGLPIGLLVTGPHYREDNILRVAAAFEGATEWHTKHPTL
jgi:Asp-tRNA(Asn)/Glu-tRNA(Gln) amidotransferase A subunit family amidase